MPAPQRDPADTLAVLKALGDPTRFRCFEIVRDAGRPVSVADVAEAMGLHHNTVRAHLERLREVGLLEVSSSPRGTVGRPQNLYEPVGDLPPLGLAPRRYHLLSDMLAALASRVAGPDDAAQVGRQWGARLGAGHAAEPGGLLADPVDVVERTFDSLGFDPVSDGDRVTFTNCPFQDLAEHYPEVVCSLHRGLCEGVVRSAGEGRVEAFHALHSREPCTVVLSRR